MRPRTSTPLPASAVAVIGIGCRFPGGANSPEAFWKLLLEGVDTVGEIPPDRWDVDAYYHPDPSRPGKMYSRHGCFLPDMDLFDADFFGISPREAACMDPQQRLLLEVAWEALEDAGQPPGRLAGAPVGVFVGVCLSDYGVVRQHDILSIDAYTRTGSSFSIAANRISHAFDFRGPSLAIDTACSSSLVAVDLACRSLLSGESILAVAGGVSLMFDPTISIGYCKAGMLSSLGRCNPFDAGADGYVRGEGAGIVALKLLSEALADGDPIYALIRATAANQDGRTNGIMMPSSLAQEDLLRQVYARAVVAPSAVQYVEAHGTGTLVGDRVECDALGKVLGVGRSDGDFLRIGSVKSNIGHLEAAAGIAGLIKAALALKHRYLPADPHFTTPNPSIPFDALRLRVQQEGEPWPETEEPAIAGVNSFGFGGTSAHAVLEELTALRATGPAPLSRRAMLLPLSARSPEALRACAKAYLDFLNRSQSLQDLCYTASTRRDRHPHRLALVGRTHAELRESLEAFLEDEGRPGLSVGARPASSPPELVFVFSGNGSQWQGMGRQLLAEEPVFRQTVETCDALLSQHTSWSLLAELLAGRATTRTHIAQPALFALQVGLVALWRSWGMEPSAVIGHSIGEVAAAHVAGILSLEDAIRVIFHRSQTQELIAGSGGMAAVGLSAAAARDALAAYGDRLCIAAINSPASVTLSGDQEALEHLLDLLKARDVFCRSLPLNSAFHSHHVEPIRSDLLASLERLETRPASLRFVSTVPGYESGGSDLGAEYWWDNVRQPVEFSPAIETLIEDGHRIFLEIGPHPVLGNYVAECLMTRRRPGWVLSSLRRKEDERTMLLRSLGTLYTLGCAPDWKALHPGGGDCIRLPSYPWQRKRHWLEIGVYAHRRSARQVHPLLGHRLNSAQPAFEGQLDIRLLPYLEDHKVQGATVLPVTGYIEMALAAVDLHGEGPWALGELEIRRTLVLSGTSAPAVKVTLSHEDGVFRVHSRAGEENRDWILHAAGRILKLQPPPGVRRLEVDQIQARLTRELSKGAFYDLVERHGLQFGSSIKLVEHLWAGDGEALGEICLSRVPDLEVAGYIFHPAALDACIQVTLAALSDQPGSGELPTYMVAGLDRLRVYRRPRGRLLSHARVVKRGSDYRKVDYTIADRDGEVIAEITGLRLKRVHLGQSQPAAMTDDQLYEERWLLKPLPASSRHRSARLLPAPSSLADLERVMPEYEELSAELGRTRYYQEIRPRMEALSTAYITRALRQLGWEPLPGEQVTLAGLVERLGIQPQHERLMMLWLCLLEQDGVLRRVGEAWEVQRAPDAVDPGPLYRDLALAFPACQPDLLLLARCGAQLAQALTGQADPLQIMGERDWTTLEHFYESGVTTRIHNALMQAVVSKIVDGLPPDRSLRILEIGAGTGGTTTHLLPQLPPERTEYVFTDISEQFLQKAAHRYEKFPFVRYQRLDIEEDPTTQGFEEHFFDLVIASNVVHATRDLRSALRNVQRLLASEGLLALMEVTNPPRMAFVTFGLLPGFWLFMDEDLRPRQALLSQDRWIGLLEDVGFTGVVGLAERAATPDQSILLARAPRLGQLEVAEDREQRCWLIFEDQAGVARQVGGHLEARGDRVLFVEKGDTYERHAENRFQVSPGDCSDMARLFRTLRSEQVAVTAVAYCWSLDAMTDQLTTDTLRAAQELGPLNAVRLIQHLAEARLASLPRLWLVTGGAQALRAGKDRVSIAQSSLVGLRRVIFNEHPELRCTLIDIGLPTLNGGELRYRPEELEGVVGELCSDDLEDEVVLRGQDRYVGRLVRASPPSPPRAGGGPGAYRLETPTSGRLESIGLQGAARRRPHAGEVEIKIHAAGLNFRDILLATGLLATEDLENGYSTSLGLGLEGAGKIVAVGDAVTEFQVGDEVIAVGGGTFAAYMTTEAAFVVPKPPHISFEEAATLLMSFMTAHYALHRLAQLREGERVLIHHATGGVGMAAVQVVRAAGGELFATAGSTEKRKYLRLLGVERIMDSRSLAFADEIMEMTNGEGVDIVLNSLTGEGLVRSLGALRRFGRFLEIGKRDLLGNARVGLRPFRRSLSLHAVDIDQLMLEDQALVRSLLAEIMARVQDGTYRPLPHRTFPVSRALEAFRYMQQARHLGKVVISMRDHNVAVAPSTPSESIKLRPDATYLISGGLGGFGLATARWMVEQGARHLVLVSRRGAASAKARAAVAALRAEGAEVLVAEVDVSQEEQVRELMATIRASLPPLRGVVQAAMVLKDAPVLELNESLLDEVMAPKVLGTWNLHHHTLGEPLDFFVLFSSVASVFGNPGQGNYVAANAFLEGFTAFRRAQGLPALAINWGGIADVGYIAELAERGEQLLERMGLHAMAPELALERMGRLLQEGQTRTIVADIDWRQIKAAWPASPRWANLLPGDDEVTPSHEQGGAAHHHGEGFRQRLVSAAAEERRELVTASLSDHLARVLGASVGSIDPERPMADVGLDSLMAVELRSRIERYLGADVPVLQIQARSLAELASYLIEQLTESEPVGVTAQA